MKEKKIQNNNELKFSEAIF